VRPRHALRFEDSGNETPQRLGADYDGRRCFTLRHE